MKETTPERGRSHGRRALLFYALGFVVLGALIGCCFMVLKLNRDLKQEQAMTASLTAELATATSALTEASTTITALATELNLTTEELEDVRDDYLEERERNEDFEREYRDIIDTVKDLDKLSKTDEELLQKYSKVYFLNEHYVPESLRDIPDEWKYTESRDLEVHSRVLPFLGRMLEDAKDDGVDIWVVSAYRSFDTQGTLKGQYTVTYGSGANAFSADQGYSEHQLGTTLDFTTTGLNGGLDGFQNTPAYEWLTKNAHRYGFTLSYPSGNAYYVFEPWHWRFVGEDLAKDLRAENAHFYDWDQRKINTYLLNIFD